MFSGLCSRDVVLTLLCSRRACDDLEYPGPGLISLGLAGVDSLSASCRAEGCVEGRNSSNLLIVKKKNYRSLHSPLWDRV